VRCPRCFAVAFQGARFCRKCGASLANPARALPEGAESDRQCPRCANNGRKSQLVANLVGDTLIDQCHDCGGIWIDQDAFDRLTSESASRQSALSALGVFPPPKLASVGKRPPVAYLRCPDCDQIMNRRNFARRSGVIIDVCRAHGIWFDHEELTRVLHFVKTGGLEKAKQEEDEERREKERSARIDRMMADMRQSWTGRDLDDSGLFERPSIVIGLLRGISRLLE
jgi:Zn-finger nucleic acid-binding protein